MKIRELKEFINSLTEEQLDQEARFYPDGAVETIASVEVSTEDWLFDAEYPEEGLFRASEMGDINEGCETKVGLPKGTVMFFGE